MSGQVHSASAAVPNQSVRASRLAGLALLLALCPRASFAQASPCAAPPPYKYLRYDEDYRYLRDPECGTDPFDKIKFIPLNKGGDVYLSFGGEIRHNVEYFHNAQWGKGSQGPAYSLQRYMGHLDFHWGDRFRLFGQMKSGLEFGRAGGPRPFDKDELALSQAFVDVGITRNERASLVVRVGRQELAYGTTRWVSVREGPTVHQNFDAARAIFTVDAWRFDAFLSKPAETHVGLFDDHTDPIRTFWGVYATGPIQKSRTNIDLYYFGLRHSNAKFQQGMEFERRQTLRNTDLGHRWRLGLRRRASGAVRELRQRSYSSLGDRIRDGVHAESTTFQSPLGTGRIRRQRRSRHARSLSSDFQSFVPAGPVPRTREPDRTRKYTCGESGGDGSLHQGTLGDGKLGFHLAPESRGWHLRYWGEPRSRWATRRRTLRRQPADNSFELGNTAAPRHDLHLHALLSWSFPRKHWSPRICRPNLGLAGFQVLSLESVVATRLSEQLRCARFGRTANSG